MPIPTRTEQIAIGSLIAIVLTGLAWHLRGLYRLSQLDSAILVLHRLNALESQFAQTHPDKGFTCNLSDLRELERSDEALTPQISGGRRKSGNIFEVFGCSNERPNHRYRILAFSEGEAVSSACTDQSGVVTYGMTPPACRRP
jgi:ATP phosphoribosyltransferase regulatory subunit HisZ